METKANYQDQFSNRSKNLPSSFIREILKVASQPNFISFAGGLPDPALFPLQELEQSAAEVFRKYGSTLLQYSRTEGLDSLKKWICNFYFENYQMKVGPNQILITSGSQQALDLLGKVFLNPGEQLLLEQPSYLGAVQAFMAYEPEILPVPTYSDGIDLEALQQILLIHRPKMLYLVSNFQNPSCSTISQEKRKILGELARKYKFLVIEDDPYGQLRFEGEDLKPIRYYNSASILCGSFSKLIAPGLRTGWIVADEEVIQKLLVLKQASDLHSNNLSQFIIDHFLRNYSFQNHLQRVRKSYAEKSRFMYEIATSIFPKDCSISRPEGGMFLWVELPQYMDAELILNHSLKEKVAFVPGKFFFTNGKGHNTLRLNFTNSTVPNIEKGLGVIREVIYHLYQEQLNRNDVVMKA